VRLRMGVFSAAKTRRRKPVRLRMGVWGFEVGTSGGKFEEEVCEVAYGIFFECGTVLVAYESFFEYGTRGNTICCIGFVRLEWIFAHPRGI